MSLLEKASKFSNEQIEKINNDLIIKIPTNKYNKSAPIKEIGSYFLDSNDYLYVPLAYGAIDLNLPRRLREKFPVMTQKFTGFLRDEQINVQKEALKILSKTGSIILSLHTGFGKTILSINLACEIRLKTLIIVNKIVLINQWEESILKFCPTAKIQKLTTKSDFDNDCNFFIMNATNVSKKKKSFFRNIGLCIVDECHLIMAESLSKSLQCIFPRYLIGLSATPYRMDGLDGLLELYFGKNRIIRLLRRKHIVYKVKTGITIKMALTEDGKINWGSILDEQCNNIERNEIIISICKKFNDRNILILTKRVEQGKYLYNRLVEDKENVASLLGSQQEFDRECRILVATTSKASTGFDFSKLDCLIISSDLESYFVQALGRVLRRPDVEPIVFDLIDENKILEKHFNSRKEVYDEIGGTIRDYSIFMK
jgi:superfamily II DNA or RNA helicase